MTSFLQSKEWQNFQENLGRKTFRKAGKNWSFLAVLESGTLNTRLYTPYGPDCNSEESFKEALKELEKLGREQKATFVRVEPTYGLADDFLKSCGLKKVAYQQLQPAHTQIIDLSRTEDQLLAEMSQNSRNITRNIHKKGVTIRTSINPSEVKILTDLLAGVAGRNGINTHSFSYYKTQAEVLMLGGSALLYIAELDGAPIAASLVFDGEDTRIYAHAAASDEHRRLQAGTALVGKMILDAKAKGLKYFDLFGIAPEDQPNHPWAGFSRFKKSFGGQSVAYPGACDLPLKPIGYLVYRAYQTLRRKLR